MALSAQQPRIFIEELEETAVAATVQLRQAVQATPRLARPLTTTLFVVGFVLAVCYVAHCDFVARRDLRHSELTHELASVQAENQRLSLRLEYLTSHAQIMARARANGYDYPDQSHSHSVRVASVPWEAEARALADAPHPSLFASLWNGVTATFHKVAASPEQPVTLAQR
jgi:hypothetical protein